MSIDRLATDGLLEKFPVSSENWIRIEHKMCHVTFLRIASCCP